MKKMFKYIFILLSVTLIVPACSEDYLDVNTDPNNPTTVTPDLALPVAENYTATYQYTDRRTNTLGNMLMANWSQSDGYAWYPDEFKYLVTSSFYSNNFNIAYQNPLKQYNTIDRPDDPTYDYYTSIAMIMKAYHFNILVDMYGDVPYTEALQRSLDATPKYDDALTIYEDLIVKLTAAIEKIKNATEVALEPAEDDVIFGGDMGKWIQFANTIKLRILVRQSDMADRNTYVTDQINAIVAEGSGFIEEDVAVNPGYRKEVDKQNPFWDAYGADAVGTPVMNFKATSATQYALDKLTDFNDPRIDYIYEKPADGHLGVPQGLLDYDTPVLDRYIPDNVSNFGPGLLKGPEQDAVIFTLAESFFNQSEAALKGYLAGSAKSFYQSGITASFEYLIDAETVLIDVAGEEVEVTIPEFATLYFSQGIVNVSWDISTNKEEAIIVQKWIALNGIDAIQSWFDYNRTGFPSDVPIPLNYTATADRPVRLMYPASELASNSDNVPSQLNPFTQKIFWAQ